jgi:hypothetical protein
MYCESDLYASFLIDMYVRFIQMCVCNIHLRASIHWFLVPVFRLFELEAWHEVGL